MGTDRSYKVAIIAPTCFYYQAPLFRALANNNRLDLTVYFCSDEGVTGKDVEVAYGSNMTWGVEGEILSGYSHKFLRNYSPWGSYLKSLVGLINIGVMREIAKTRPDAVVVMSWMNPTWWMALLVCRIFNVPMLLMTDANVSAERLKKPWKTLIKRWLLGKALFRVTKGFLCAGTANQQLYKYFGVPETKLVQFAYSWGYETLVKESTRLKHRKAELKAQYGIPKDAFVVLYSGRLSPEKGSLELLEAYRLTSPANKVLVLVGDGRLRPQMQKFVGDHNLESVYFVGFQNREEILNFYTMADVLVLPSRLETWGLVVSEALCFSLPVIVSEQVGAGVDLVIDGKNGYVFPADDVKLLAHMIDKIVELPQEERLRMGETSQNLIKQWSARNLGNQLSEYLDSIYQVRCKTELSS